MEQRFRNEEPSDTRLSPNEVDEVTRLYFQREEQRQRERERLASMVSPEEVALALGTTPEEVANLAEEVRTKPRQAEPPVERLVPKPPDVTGLHAAYLSAIAGLLIVGGIAFSKAGTKQPAVFAPTSPGMTSKTLPASRGGAFGANYTVTEDPYLNGPVRDLGWLSMHQPPEELLVDPTVSAPPQGLKVSLVTPLAKKTILGPTGSLKAGAKSGEELRAAIRSLLKYEESLATVTGHIPVVDPEKVPTMPGRADFQGQPVYLGWHVVEISDGRGSFRAVLPDARYFADRPEVYRKTMEQRLRWLSDGKFVPGEGTARLEGQVKHVRLTTPLPKGVTLSMSHAGQTVVAEGTADPSSAVELLPSAIRDFVVMVSRDGLIPMDVPQGGDGKLPAVSVIATYPGGEEEIPNFAIDYDPDYRSPDEFRGTQDNQLKDLVEHIRGSIEAHGPLKPRGTIKLS